MRRRKAAKKSSRRRRMSGIDKLIWKVCKMDGKSLEMLELNKLDNTTVWEANRMYSHSVFDQLMEIVQYMLKRDVRTLSLGKYVAEDIRIVVHLYVGDSMSSKDSPSIEDL